MFINFAKECAHKWKELSSEEKAFYHKLSKEDGYRYERELQEYKQLAESQTKRSESTCKLEVNVHFEQPGPPVNQTKTVIHATTLLADSIPSKETHESSDQLIGEARLASHVPTTECVLLSIESPNDSLSNGPANSMGSSKRKVSLETASESDSTRIDHTDESIEKRSNEIEVFESILPETDVQNESIEPCDESIKAVTGVARIETYDEFPTSILTSRVAQSGNSKKNENGFSNFLNEKETAETYFLDDLNETVNTIETTAETDLAVGIEEPKVPFVKPFRQSIDHSSEELGELDDLAKENNMKPFNGNTPNLEDEAFDLFANEQMPLVREIFAPLHRRMSGEEMLDELLNRWTKLPAHLKDGYFYKAMQSQDEQTAWTFCSCLFC